MQKDGNNVLDVVQIQQQEEIYGYIECIDVFEVKLQFFVREVIDLVRKVVFVVLVGSFEKKLVEKDQQIVQFMEEGKKFVSIE